MLGVYKVFGSLIWCEWAYGTTLTLLGLWIWRWGLDFASLRVDLKMVKKGATEMGISRSKRLRRCEVGKGEGEGGR